MPCAAKKAASASVRVTTPANGRHTRKAPIRIASTALSNVHTKPGTLLVVNKAASPTNPLVKNSHPAKVSTTSVATKGEAAASSPRIAMTTPGTRKRTQWRRIAALTLRRTSSTLATLMTAPWSVIERLDASPRALAAGALLEREDALPVVLHADYRPAFVLRLVVERRRKGADLAVGQTLRRAVGVLSRSVVVQHEHLQPRAGAGPLQHLPVAGRVAERRVGPATDHEVNPFRLAGVVVVQDELRLLGQERLAVLAVAVFRSTRCADHLLGRDAVDLVGIDAHEVLTAAGHDVGLVGVVAQVTQHFEHRLIDELGIRPLPARIARGFEPLLRFGVELLHRHAGQRRGEDLLEVAHRELRYRLAVAGEHGLERLGVPELRPLRRHRRDALQAVDHLRVHRMLDPQRAVLIEHRDAVLRNDVARTRSVDGRAHEIEDRLLCRPFVP